ncbi:MAG: GNAT family protein [Alphaproteobacteria bacterium]
MANHVNSLNQPIGAPLPDWKACDRPPRTVLEGRYCRLEPVDIEKHADGLFAAFREDREDRIWTYLPYGPFETVEALRDWMGKTCLSDDPQFFTIVDTASGAIGGVASYLRIAPPVGCIEVGHINYAPRLQKSAAATETMYLMMKQVFETLGYRRYEWKCDSLNAGSMGAAKRLGFTFEGIFRQATIYKGRNRDTAWFSIVDSEWPALREAFEIWLSPDNFDEAGKQRLSLSGLTAKALARTGD